MANFELLDNPIWNALTTEHRQFSLGDGVARRYMAAIGPLSGIQDQSDEAYEALRGLAGSTGMIGLFLEQPYAPRRGWQLARDGRMVQMISLGAPDFGANPLPSGAVLRPLTTADIPQMVALAKLTEPGPFRERTSELGAFFGIFELGRLVAMSGQRMRLPGLVEISAVCTHPEARGRGYARATMIRAIGDAVGMGAVPFLHAFENNYAAIRVYEGLGFTLRRILHLAILKSQG